MRSGLNLFWVFSTVESYGSKHGFATVEEQKIESRLTTSGRKPFRRMHVKYDATCRSKKNDKDRRHYYYFIYPVTPTTVLGLLKHSPISVLKETLWDITCTRVDEPAHNTKSFACCSNTLGKHTRIKKVLSYEVQL